MPTPEEYADEILAIVEPHTFGSEIEALLGKMVAEWQDAEDRVRFAEDEAADAEGLARLAEDKLQDAEEKIADQDGIEYEAKGKIMDGTDPKEVLAWTLRELTGTEVVL